MESCDGEQPVILDSGTRSTYKRCCLIRWFGSWGLEFDQWKAAGFHNSILEWSFFSWHYDCSSLRKKLWRFPSFPVLKGSILAFRHTNVTIYLFFRFVSFSLVFHFQFVVRRWMYIFKCRFGSSVLMYCAKTCEFLTVLSVAALRGFYNELWCIPSWTNLM